MTFAAVPVAVVQLLNEMVIWKTDDFDSAAYSRLHSHLLFLGFFSRLRSSTRKMRSYPKPLYN